MTDSDRELPSSILQALNTETAIQKKLREFEDSPTSRLIRDLDRSTAATAKALADSQLAFTSQAAIAAQLGSTIPTAFRSQNFATSIGDALKNLPTATSLRAFEQALQIGSAWSNLNSVRTFAAREMDRYKFLSESLRYSETSAFKALQSMRQQQSLTAALQFRDLHPILNAATSLADRINTMSAQHSFVDAYELIKADVPDINSDVAISEEIIAEVVDRVHQRIKAAPRTRSSVEFVVNLVVALSTWIYDNEAAQLSEQRLSGLMAQHEHSAVARHNLVLDRLSELQTGLLHYIDQSEEPDNLIYLVAETELNLRSGPGQHHQILNVIRQGQKVVLINLQDDWYEIEYFDALSNQVLRGWSHRDFLIMILQQ